MFHISYRTMQNSESGRKINQAVNTTSRAVGGAISQAKGALSSWWSSITTAPPANSTGAACSGSGIGTAGDASSQQGHSGLSPQIDEGIDGAPQEISVTFQNHKDETELDMAGVSIHISTSLDKEDNLVEAHDSTGNSPHQQPQGIVEIGREAELLDRVSQSDDDEHATVAGNNSQAQSQSQSQSQSFRAGCGGDLALSSSSSSAVDRNSGDVFIV